MEKVITCKDIHAGDEIEFYLQDAVRFRVLEREAMDMPDCGPCVSLTLKRADGTGAPYIRVAHRETTRVLLVHRPLPAGTADWEMVIYLQAKVEQVADRMRRGPLSPLELQELREAMDARELSER